MLDYSKRITIDPVLELLPGQIFTFGSNESGRHGKGAALTAMKWGAKWGQSSGLMGRTYGIPTKGKKMNIILTVNRVGKYVDEFIEFAKTRPDLTFLVTKIGCGLANGGDKNRHVLIAPLTV